MSTPKMPRKWMKRLSSWRKNFKRKSRLRNKERNNAPFMIRNRMRRLKSSRMVSRLTRKWARWKRSSENSMNRRRMKSHSKRKINRSTICNNKLNLSSNSSKTLAGSQQSNSKSSRERYECPHSKRIDRSSIWNPSLDAKTLSTKRR